MSNFRIWMTIILYATLIVSCEANYLSTTKSQATLSVETFTPTSIAAHTLTPPPSETPLSTHTATLMYTYAPSPTLIPTSSYTPTATSTPDYYTEEERMLETSLYRTEHMMSGGYDGVNYKCNTGQPWSWDHQSLPPPGERLYGIYQRIEPNLWMHKSSRVFSNDTFHSTHTLEFKGDVIIETSLFSGPGGQITCQTTWVREE